MKRPHPGSSFTYTHFSSIPLPACPPHHSPPPSDDPLEHKGYRAALLVLHDPSTLLTLDKRILSFAESPNSSHSDVNKNSTKQENIALGRKPSSGQRRILYDVSRRHRLVPSGCYGSQAVLKNLDNGLEMTATTPPNTTIERKITIRVVIVVPTNGNRRLSTVRSSVSLTDEGDGEQQLEITESVVVRCPKILKAWMQWRLRDRSKVMHEKFKRAWSDRMLELPRMGGYYAGGREER